MDVTPSRSVTDAWRIEVPVASLMRRHWIATAPRTSLLDASHLMRLARVRQLPVTENGKLLGLLDHTDLLRASLDELWRPTPGGRAVSALMDPQPPSALPEETLEIVVARMLAAGLACIPVIGAPPPAEPVLVGLLVESDLLHRIYAAGASPAP